jgi:hypothetical protein
MLSLALLMLINLIMQEDYNILTQFFLPFMFTTCPQLCFLNLLLQINAIIRKFWWAGIQIENPFNPIAQTSGRSRYQG